MVVNIGGKEYTLIFGWGFLEEINKRLGLEEPTLGISLQQGGIIMLEAGLELYDPVTLVHIIQSATITERQKPSKTDIQHFVEKKMEDGEYVDFYKEVNEEIKKQPLLNNLIKALH